MKQNGFLVAKQAANRLESSVFLVIQSVTLAVVGQENMTQLVVNLRLCS
jgi:hypothetical protein